MFGSVIPRSTLLSFRDLQKRICHFPFSIFHYRASISIRPITHHNHFYPVRDRLPLEMLQRSAENFRALVGGDNDGEVGHAHIVRGIRREVGRMEIPGALLPFRHGAQLNPQFKEFPSLLLHY